MKLEDLRTILVVCLLALGGLVATCAWAGLMADCAQINCV